MAELPAKSNRGDIAAFLTKLKTLPATGGGVGRLIFALDATASREPSWTSARKLQGEMFRATQGIGALAVQLAWYRGAMEFRASPWASDAETLVRRMNEVTCLAGETQIAAVLRHALAETARARVNAVVFVGDACEESIDALSGLAGQLGLKNVPVFVFHEGGEPVARRCFEQIARVSGGAYCPFDARAGDQLRDLLAGVATFAVGGRKALQDFAAKRGGAALLLTKR